MPSLRYRMLEKMFSLIGVNKMLDKEGEEWEKLLAAQWLCGIASINKAFVSIVTNALFIEITASVCRTSRLQPQAE